MSKEEDLIRIEAFRKELDSLNEKYHLAKPIRDYYDFGYRPEKIQRRFAFYFKDNIDLELSIREECLAIFLNHFHFPEGVHGLVGKKSP